MDSKRMCQVKRKFRSSRITPLLLLTGLTSFAIAPVARAQSGPPAAQCYAQSLTFGASERDRDRAAYLCEGATSIAPAQCYWQALGFGATVREQDRAARLCRGLDDGLESQTADGSLTRSSLTRRSLTGSSNPRANPAQCYWDYRRFGLGQRQALRYCSAQAPLEIPQAIRDCVFTTRRQLRVSRSSALIACSNLAQQ